MYPSIKNMAGNELFDTVEEILTENDVNNPSSTWEETADSIRGDNPELAKWIDNAASKWSELQ